MSETRGGCPACGCGGCANRLSASPGAGVTDIVEVQIGHDGLVVANAANAPEFDLTRIQLFQALANGQGEPERWSDIDPPQKAHVRVVPRIEEYAAEFVSDEAWRTTIARAGERRRPLGHLSRDSWGFRGLSPEAEQSGQGTGGRRVAQRRRRS